MTEDQAKEKWCPFAGEQRMERQHENCIGNACMTWRWDHKQPPGHGFDADGTPHPGGNGYCGLAGKP